MRCRLGLREADGPPRNGAKRKGRHGVNRDAQALRQLFLLCPARIPGRLGLLPLSRPTTERLPLTLKSYLAVRTGTERLRFPDRSLGAGSPLFRDVCIQTLGTPSAAGCVRVFGHTAPYLRLRHPVPGIQPLPGGPVRPSSTVSASYSDPLLFRLRFTTCIRNPSNPSGSINTVSACTAC